MKWFEANKKLPIPNKMVLVLSENNTSASIGEYSEDGFLYSLEKKSPWEYKVDNQVTHWATIPKKRKIRGMECDKPGTRFKLQSFCMKPIEFMPIPNQPEE